MKLSQQARDDTIFILFDLTTLYLIVVFALTSITLWQEKVRLERQLTEMQTELTFKTQFMLNCLNRRTFVVGGIVGVECFTY